MHPDGSTTIHRRTHYSEFTIPDFVKSRVMNPPCMHHNKPTGKFLDYVLNSPFDKNREYIKAFFRFGLSHVAKPIPEGQYKYKGRIYNIETGPRGGRFILTVNGEKVRIEQQTCKRRMFVYSK